jgi:DNA-3-methyladenine glycosylase II
MESQHDQTRATADQLLQTLENQAFRLNQLGKQLTTLPKSSQSAGLNTLVTLESNNKTTTYLLVPEGLGGTTHANITLLSTTSPLASSFLNHKLGFTFTFNQTDYQITQITSKDPVIKHLIKTYPLPPLGEPDSLFLELVETIVSQQLSVKVSDTIFTRLLSLLMGKKRSQIVPQDVLNLTTDHLRSVGLSGSKASYVHNIANAIINDQIKLDQFSTMTNDEVFDAIVGIKGLGPWSAEMFLIFSLKRPDVFSIGDLGLRSAIAKLYHVDREDTAKILKITQKWSPYRSTACRLLWKSLDNTPK